MIHRVRIFRISSVLSLFISLVCLPLAVGAQEFIGAQRCKSCHEFEYMIWARGPHAKSQAHLTPENLRDAKCNTCHTMIPGESDKRFANVQCERCHGAGEYYHRDYVMKDKELSKAVGLVTPSASHCLQCHTEGTPSIKAFDFAKMWAKISHGAEARKLWESSRELERRKK